ncbi:MAG: MBL fold metallo-hydrolase [bacterium]
MSILVLAILIILVTSGNFYISILKENKSWVSSQSNIDDASNFQGSYVIDVGQGDSLLYITKQNQTVLIDTGKPGCGIVEKLQKILGKYRRKIDVIILTHPDSDHVGEIDNILASYKVGLILYSPIYEARSTSEKIINIIKNKRYSNNNGNNNNNNSKDLIINKSTNYTLPVFAGENIIFSKSEGVYFLSPSFSGMTTFLNKTEVKEDNLFSVVTLIKNKDLILATADAPQKIEKVLASALPNVSVYKTTALVKSESATHFPEWFPNFTSITGEMFLRNEFSRIILKVGHHGSKTSSAQDFIKKFYPTDAVLSYGIDNRYGHPHQEVLDIFASKSLIDGLSYEPLRKGVEIKIHRTISGTVYFNE